ncbi:MAG: hypothetical protein CL609_21265 [Anaerolineaceae bacterium]|nr:hypothetical protein [Anaerolineaceae bacterium]
MKKIFGIFFIIVLIGILFFGCTPQSSESIPRKTQPSTTVSVAHSPTPSQTQNKPTVTFTLLPTHTPSPTDILPLEDVLLTPFFYSPTPTFDVAQVKTVTPGIPQVCPTVNTDLVFDRDIFVKDLWYGEKLEYILDYLNQGGSIPPVFGEADPSFADKNGYQHDNYKDLTGDNIPELILTIYGVGGPQTFEIIGCTTKENYESLYSFDLGGMVLVRNIMNNDLNQDGIPEIVLRWTPTMGSGYISGYHIIAWDGNAFQNLITQTEFDGVNKISGIQNGWIRMNGVAGNYPLDGNPWQIKDIDQNSTLEMLISGGIGVSLDEIRHGPYQPVTQIFMWNGEGFVMDDMQIGPPEYRFQAIQNGDLYTLMHKYERAYEAYRQVIDDPYLAWWSEESVAFISAELDAQLEKLPTPTLSAPDKNEYPYLAAYAMYRIFLLHILQGQMKEAELVYSALQAQYIPEMPGHIFTQLAKTFWNSYKASEDIHTACADTVDYALPFQDEVLRYIGGYHGWQSLDYELTDICPFL